MVMTLCQVDNYECLQAHRSRLFLPWLVGTSQSPPVNVSPRVVKPIGLLVRFEILKLCAGGAGSEEVEAKINPLGLTIGPGS